MTTMGAIPFLPTQQQEKFLRDRQMIDHSTLSTDDKEWLRTVNFHFLMGYARHYRDLTDSGYRSGPKRFAEIRALVDAEADLATFLTPWIRRAELHIRAVTVKHFCSAQGTGEGYLDPSSWTTRGAVETERLQVTMLRDILRHGEPYVTDEIKARARARGMDVPRWCDRNNAQDVTYLVQNLPFWAIVDSFTVGTLGKFLRYCGRQPGGTKQVNDLVAKELNVPKRAFNITVECFGITRNLVFHHQRLWMRPMPKSPGFSKELDRRYPTGGFKTTNKQAHFIALASISRLLPAAERETYLDALDKFLDERPLFKMGIVSPPFAQFRPKAN